MNTCKQTKVCRVRVNDKWTDKPIDICLVRLVSALNAIGAETASSHCGNGKTAGKIVLRDGTIIKISKCENYDS